MKNFIGLIIFFTSFPSWSIDPMFSDQWALSNQGQKVYRSENDIRRGAVQGIPGMDIDWPGVDALSEVSQGREVIVAVIDSGIDMGHPEFKDRLYVGKDFLDNKDMMDDTGHGTHVAGIISANADGVGIQGASSNGVKILPLKVLNKDVTSFVYKRRLITDIIADAIAYAIEANVAVINMSLGWPKIINTPKITKVLDAAAEKGIVLVAASGNNNKEVPTWPCSHPAVICVGAVDNEGKLTEFSNHGGKVDLVAPGEWIISTFPRGLESRSLRKQGYEAKNGSSQAAPFVSATAAMLKLQNPDMKLSEIKARLYSSARKLKRDVDNRYVRFGALSMRGALSEERAVVSSVLVKDLVTVAVSESGEFKFTLPLEILGSSEMVSSIELLGPTADIRTDGKSVYVTGKIRNLEMDSEVHAVFKVTVEGVVTKTPLTLSFSRTLSPESMVSVKIPGIKAGALMVQQGPTKASRLGLISVEDKASSDFHGYIQKKEGDKIIVTSIRADLNASETINTDITLSDHHQLLSIFEKDMNFDGMNDLIFYGMNARRDHLVLTISDLAGNALFGDKSRWELPISTFEGLPLKEGERADFSWLKINSLFGEILVPYYQKSWMMPEMDNSKKILEYEGNSIEERLYYWEPYLENNKVLIRPRVVDSVVFKKKLRKTLNAKTRETVKVERLFPQTYEERKSGSIRHLISVGDGFQRRFSFLQVNSSIESQNLILKDQDSFLASTNVLVTRNFDDNSISPEPFFISLLDRSSARVKPVSEKLIYAPWILKTSGWGNPFFEVVAAYEGDERRVLIFESRYHVYLYDQQKNHSLRTHRLPINRDSSFPGVNFSETLRSVLVKSPKGNNPGVAVNSTLIYGDRLYTMVALGEKFVRPVTLSVSVPENCVPLKTQILSKTLGYSAYAMMCSAGDGVKMTFFPLEIK
jgi:cell wall-associated protease